jgi:CheY-like chemotaxis protein
MEITKVPSLYFKPYILFVDDDAQLLEVFEDELSESFSIETYNSPHLFIDRLQESKVAEDNIASSRTVSDDSFERCAVIHLDYRVLAQKLETLFCDNQLISVVFIDFFMPEMTGLECASQIRNTLACRVLLTASLDNKEVIVAFNNNIIHQYLSKAQDDLIDCMKKTIEKSHSNSVEKANKQFFGEFYDQSGYKDLFETEAFIALYTSVIKTHTISFACVYEAGGSMRMLDTNGQFFLFNIYSQDEIRNILCESVEFEQNVSTFNKKQVEEYKIIIDYKNITSEQFINSHISRAITDQFWSVCSSTETYYVTFRKLGMDREFFD